MSRNAAGLLLGAMVLIYPMIGHAQMLIDQGLGMATDSVMGMQAHQPMDIGAVTQRLQQQGYSNVQLSPDDPAHFMAETPDGARVMLILDPATGKIVSIVPQ